MNIEQALLRIPWILYKWKVTLNFQSNMSDKVVYENELNKVLFSGKVEFVIVTVILLDSL